MKDSLSIEELVEQFLEREQAGEILDIDAFAAEHPDCADELRNLLILMRDMERLKPNSQTNYMQTIDERIDFPDSSFKLIRELGHGGMGTVFEAVQIALDRHVALKVLNFSLSANAEQRAQFENEAKVIAMLHHPNIVKIYSAGCDEKHCYYAMELIDGQGLNRCHCDDERTLAQLGLQVAQALAYAHRCNVLHRDVKPANMLLDSEGNVHISDFGISCMTSDGKPIIENDENRSGTLRYMAPERLKSGINSFATDQYSFGVSLYELLIGQPLFMANSFEELKDLICHESACIHIFPKSPLAAIVQKCVSFDPNNRYANMNEVALELQRFLNHEPVKAFHDSFYYRLTLWCRRKPTVALLTFVSIGCALAFVISLIVGYLQTQAALRLAKQNAAVADTAISQIFSHLAEQPPSSKNATLLSTLVPYYQMIAQQRNIPESKICEAYAVIGECAMRVGDYAMAADAYRQMTKYRSDLYPINQLAMVLRKQGKIKESEHLSQSVIAKFGKCNDAESRFEIVRALLTLSKSLESKEREQAFRILEILLKEYPNNPDYRFQYAVILGANPLLHRLLRIRGVEPNAIRILTQLVDAHPERPDYCLALIDLMNKKMYLLNEFSNNQDMAEAAEIVLISEKMLGRWPNDPQIISAVIELHSRYIDLLRQRNDDMRARKVNDRLLGILEILFYHPDISNSIKEELIDLQLQRLQFLRHHGDKHTQAMHRKIKQELESYQGPRKEDFYKQLGN